MTVKVEVDDEGHELATYVLSSGLFQLLFSETYQTVQTIVKQLK